LNPHIDTNALRQLDSDLRQRHGGFTPKQIGEHRITPGTLRQDSFYI